VHRIQSSDDANESFVLEWCWTDWPQDYRRYIWRLGCTRWRSFLWQGLHQSWSFCCVCCSVGCQISGEVWTVQALPSTGNGLSLYCDNIPDTW